MAARAIGNLPREAPRDYQMIDPETVSPNRSSGHFTVTAILGLS